MADNEETKKSDEDFKELRKKIDNKKGKDISHIVKQVATREKLERDYLEDLLEVVFFSSPETKRMVKTRRPTQTEMILIMKLSAQASILEGRTDAKSLEKIVEVYEELPKMAGRLAVDKKLNEDFWKNKISFTTLQNFITELIKETQKGSGVSSEDLDSFR